MLAANTKAGGCVESDAVCDGCMSAAVLELELGEDGPGEVDVELMVMATESG